MSEIKLLPCPVCNSKSVKLNEFYETSDGRGDRWPSIECKCGLSLSLTTDEFNAAQDEFGYTGGYYSENKEFWNGMHQRLIDKWNIREPMPEIVNRLEAAKRIDKIGLIRRMTNPDGKQTFEYIESRIKKIVIGKKKTSVYSDGFYPLELEDLESTTRCFNMETGLMIVGEPFITNDRLAAWCQKSVDYWNEHGAKSLLDD